MPELLRHQIKEAHAGIYGVMTIYTLCDLAADHLRNKIAF